MGSFANPVSSDHHAVSFPFSAPKSLPQPAVIRSFLQFRKADMTHLETLLHLAPWSAFMDDADPDASWVGFLDILEAAATTHDSIRIKQRRRTKCSPWITPELKKLIYLKHQLFNKAKHSSSSSAWLQYKQIRNKVKYKTAYYINSLFAARDNKRSFGVSSEINVNRSVHQHSNMLTNCFRNLMTLPKSPRFTLQQKLVQLQRHPAHIIFLDLLLFKSSLDG